ncbi:DUF2975 domain-containing protein [Streptomyces sp. NPDC092369]|uniref:DUF2975 domain-containing protein n=1 Tax=Streptomyces sp. NPDC092369 TaxID=3366015 RepID=UPI00381C8E44
MPEDRKLLEPMATVVSVVLRTLLALVAAGLILNVVHGGLADVSVCVTDDSTTSSESPAGLLPEPGAQVDSVPRYCAQNPDATLRLLNQLGDLPSTLLLISGLFLLHRLLQGAVRDGVYTARTAARLRLLGWWLLVGSLVAEIVEANVRAAVLADLAQAADFTAMTWLGLWSPPYLAVLTGLGLLTFARITRAGAAMREDLEGVV